MDSFSTPDKIIPRSVLRELNQNETMNNKPVRSSDDHRGVLKGDSGNVTCDDLINNFNNLGLVTPQRNSNQLSVNANTDLSNSPSSDDEVFQECENSFDETSNRNIVAESGNRTVNFDSTFDATINFPSANIANSTIAGPLANGNSISGGGVGGISTINMSQPLSDIHRTSLSNNRTSISSNGTMAMANGSSEFCSNSNILNLTIDGSQGMSGSINSNDNSELKQNLNEKSEEVSRQVIDNSATSEEIQVEAKMEKTDLTIEMNGIVSKNGDESKVELDAAIKHEEISVTNVPEAEKMLGNEQNVENDELPIVVKSFNSSIVVNKTIEEPTALESNGISIKEESEPLSESTKDQHESNENELDNVSKLNVTQELKYVETEKPNEDHNPTNILNCTIELPSNGQANQEGTVENDLNSTQVHSMKLNDTVDVEEQLTTPNETVRKDLDDAEKHPTTKLNDTVDMNEQSKLSVEEKPVLVLNETQHLDQIENEPNPCSEIPKDDSQSKVAECKVLNNSDMLSVSIERVLNVTLSALQDEQMDVEEALPVHQVPSQIAISVLDVTQNVISTGENDDEVANPNNTFCASNLPLHSIHPDVTFCTAFRPTNDGQNTTFCASSNATTNKLNETMIVHCARVDEKTRLQMIGEQEPMDVDEGPLQTPVKNTNNEKISTSSLNETIVLDPPGKIVNNEKRRLSLRTDLYESPPVQQETPDIISKKILNAGSEFKKPSVPPAPQPSSTSVFQNFKTPQNHFVVSDDEFQSAGFILNPSDFDFLLSKGESTPRNQSRDSILERFDPLVGRPSVIQGSAIQGTSLFAKFSPIRERDSLESHASDNNVASPVIDSDIKPQVIAVSTATAATEEGSKLNDSKITILDISNGNKTNVSELEQLNLNNSCGATKNTSIVKLDSDKKLDTSCGDESRSSSVSETYVTASIGDSLIKGNSTMSVGLIHDMNNDNMKSLEQVENKEQASLKMNEEKAKHDFVEDYERKLKEAEAREESLLRRITEKDKAMNKISAVMENYEKTMVEMITEREQLTQSFEKQIAQLKAERDANFQHLTSLETTFSDLHLKYEKSKQLAMEVKENESKLIEKLEFAQQQIKAQELRYDKLKSHALQQLEHANAKLETLSKSHINEIKKLQAQLKKEEVARQSINEQLAQKTKENEELVKICDELINNGPDGS